MNRTDRRAWATARSLHDVGVLTAHWLRGDLTETPGHCGPPEPETLPYLEVLRAVNFAGFVTENSQAADSYDGRSWEAYVNGFIAEADLPKLAAVTSPEVRITTCCRGAVHRGHRARRWLPSLFWCCPRRDVDSFYADRCPQAAGEIYDAWYITIADAEPDRNDRLWPALSRFALSAGEEAA